MKDEGHKVMSFRNTLLVNAIFLYTHLNRISSWQCSSDTLSSKFLISLLSWENANINYVPKYACCYNYSSLFVKYNLMNVSLLDICY